MFIYFYMEKGLLYVACYTHNIYIYIYIKKKKRKKRVNLMHLYWKEGPSRAPKWYFLGEFQEHIIPHQLLSLMCVVGFHNFVFYYFIPKFYHFLARCYLFLFLFNIMK